MGGWLDSRPTSKILGEKEVLLIRIAFILIILGFWETAYAGEITFLTHGSEESTYVDKFKELRGTVHAGRRAFNVELVREMMSLLNYPKQIKNYPFIRALHMVQTKPNYALFNVNRTLEREEAFKWVGPLQNSTTYFYESKKNQTGIQTIEDAKKVDLICVLNGNIHHRKLKKLGFTNLYPSESYWRCHTLLAKSKVALTPISNISTAIHKGSKFSPHIQQTPVVLSQSEGYIALSQNIPDQVIQQWQEALEKLKQSGRYDQLVQKYMFEE